MIRHGKLHFFSFFNCLFSTFYRFLLFAFLWSRLVSFSFRFHLVSLDKKKDNNKKERWNDSKSGENKARLSDSHTSTHP